MPPVVGVHERVEIDPGLLRLRKELHALGDPPTPEHHMRQRMLRPRLFGLQLQRQPRLALRRLEVMQLLVGKGQHAVEMRVVDVLRLGKPRNAQHAGRIASVETEILVQLHRCQVTRIARHNLVADGLHRRHIIGDPALELRQHHPLALVGASNGRFGACQIVRGHALGAIGLEEHPGQTGIGVRSHRIRIAIGGGDDVAGLLLVAEKAGDEIVDPLERRAKSAAHLIAEGVLCHAALTNCSSG